jgi:hypothetical protein
MLIDSDNFHYRYGNLFLLSALGSYSLSEKISLGAEVRAETRSRSTRENHQVVESSGFKMVYVIPHLSVAFAPRWFLAVNADMPVYQYYNGIQLGNEFSISLRLSYTIHLKKRSAGIGMRPLIQETLKVEKMT